MAPHPATVGIHRPLFFGFALPVPSSLLLFFGYVAAHFVTLDSLDDRARDLLRKSLREKVATIKNFLDDKNRYSTPAEAKVAFEKDRVIYLAKLKRCRIEGDRRLNSVVAEEVQKLESGFPGVTIWEKEISGRLSASLAR